MEDFFLRDGDFCATGKNRIVYFHPKDKSKVIKLIIHDAFEKNRKNNKWLIKRLRPTSFTNDNKKEAAFYEKLNEGKPIVYDCIPRFYGSIKTNLGEGIVIEYISKAVTLSNYLQKNGLDEKILVALKYFIEIIYDNAVELRDFHLHNYLVKDMPNGTLRIYVIDGLGNANFIKISSWFLFLGRIKMKKRLQRLLNNIAKIFPEKIEILKMKKLLV